MPSRTSSPPPAGRRPGTRGRPPRTGGAASRMAHPSRRPRRRAARRPPAAVADDGLGEASALPVAAVAVPSGTCPFTVDARVMRQRWERLMFVHWSYEPAIVQRLLPPWLRADTFGGMAW